MICVCKSIEIIDFTEDLPGGPVVKGLVVPEAAPATASDLANVINQIRPERQEVVVIAADHSVATRVTPHQPVPELGRDGCQTRAEEPAASE